jgi:hypothetical protein
MQVSPTPPAPPPGPPSPRPPSPSPDPAFGDRREEAEGKCREGQWTRNWERTQIPDLIEAFSPMPSAPPPGRPLSPSPDAALGERRAKAGEERRRESGVVGTGGDNPNPNPNTRFEGCNISDAACTTHAIAVRAAAIYIRELYGNTRKDNGVFGVCGAFNKFNHLHTPSRTYNSATFGPEWPRQCCARPAAL